MREPPRNLSASIRQRLLNHARAVDADPMLVLLWYGLERFLYRLSVSAYRDQFVLKGALLFRVWNMDSFRSTRDADMLAFLANDEEALRRVITAIATLDVIDDGLVFEESSIQLGEIRQAQEYGGFRVALLARLGASKIPLQIDVGFGDAVTPAAAELEYPPLLEFPAPKLRMYPRESVVAEKFEAIVSLGLINSRMKDYFDLWVLSRSHPFDGPLLTAAIKATFARRGTEIPAGIPSGLGNEFATDIVHRRQWDAFLSRDTRGATKTLVLEQVLPDLVRFLIPIAEAARTGGSFTCRWQPGIGWDEKAQ